MKRYIGEIACPNYQYSDIREVIVAADEMSHAAEQIEQMLEEGESLFQIELTNVSQHNANVIDLAEWKMKRNSAGNSEPAA